MQIKKMFINGAWIEAKNDQTRDIINPFNQEVIARVAERDKTITRQAIKAARIAFDNGDWRNTPAFVRGKLYQSAYYRTVMRNNTSSEGGTA